MTEYEAVAEKQGKERGLAGASAQENPHKGGQGAAWARGWAEGRSQRRDAVGE